MSALQDTRQYTVAEASGGPFPFSLLDDDGELVDRFRTRSGADYAARILALDSALVDEHAVFGCRVTPVRLDGQLLNHSHPVCSHCGGLV